MMLEMFQQQGTHDELPPDHGDGDDGAVGGTATCRVPDGTPSSTCGHAASTPGHAARGRGEILAVLVSTDQAFLASKSTARPRFGRRCGTVMTTEMVRRRADGRWLYLVDDPFFRSARCSERAG
jgi:hypothetical protein